VRPPVAALIEKSLARALTTEEGIQLDRLLPALKPRARTLIELADGAAFLFRPRPLPLDAGATKQLGPDGKAALRTFAERLSTCSDWSAATLEQATRAEAEAKGLKLGAIAQPLRAALTGSSVSPPIFDVMAALGREATLGRITDVTRT